MAQHDMNIANQGFPAFRSDLNNALAALVSTSSGDTEPSTTFAHQMWVDTAADPSILKIRNADNDAWITIGTINQTADTFKLTPAGGISTDTIAELTSAAGVTIDSVLLKDGGVTVSDGTVSAPTVTNTGDTNTGVYFPAADEVAIAAGGSVAAAFNSHQFMGMRNRIINGDMRIDQRNAGASLSPGADTSYLIDRFRFGTFSSGDGRLTGQQSSTAPDGFTNSLSMTVSTQDTSFSGTEGYLLAAQVIEGFNSADLMWGAANAKTVTVSFWVRSSVTGNFPFILQNNSFETAYGALYTISSADTWEYKTITIPGATTGTWLANNGIGIRVIFGGGGKDPERLAPIGWNTVDTRNMTTVTGATNLIGTLNATWYITGVQLEVGSVATPFERRPYGTELSLCQRYFWKSNPDNASNGNSAVGSMYSSTVAAMWTPYPVPMRSTPTAIFSNNSYYIPGVSANATGASQNTVSLTTQAMSFESDSLSATTGQHIRYNGQISVSAEL